MGKKPKCAAYGLKATFVLLAAFPLFASCSRPDYAVAIAMNWEIVLPSGCVEFYEKSSDPGINGDGERYHVFDCADAENMLGFIRWQGEKTMQDTSASILDALEVEDDDRPPTGAYFYYSCKKQDGSTLLLLYSSENARLYVLEEFF